MLGHSGASRAEITVRAGLDGTELEVSDDGRGEGSNGGRAPEGHGLAGLVERTRAIGGTVEAATAPAGGFRLLDVHSRMEAIRVAEERGWL